VSVSRKRAQDYAETVLSRPRSDLVVTLKRGKSGATLLHRGRAVTRCHASRVGTAQAAFMARALGVELPAQGGKVVTRVPAGILYRAVAISSLDLRRLEARLVLAQLLRVADLQRGAVSGAED